MSRKRRAVAAVAIVAVAIGVVAVARSGSSGRSRGWITFPRGSRNDFKNRIYFMHPDGSAQRDFGVVAVGGPSWSPDGRKLAFVTTDRRNDRVWIDVINRDGSGRHRITPMRWSEDCFSVVWSPNNRTLAVDRVEGCEGDTAIYTVDADGTHLRRLAGPKLGAPENRASYAEYSFNPAWSPDGRTILFTRGFRKERLFAMRADGSDQRPVAGIETRPGGGLPIQEPIWSPNGRWIFFVGAGGSLLRVGRDGSDARRLSTPSLRVVDFALSPHGSRIALTAGDGKRQSIYVVDGDGREFTRLTDNVADRCPAWSPDGRQIAFARSLTAHDNSQVYLMNADGRHLRDLSHSGRNDGCPEWLPVSRARAAAGRG